MSFSVNKVGTIHSGEDGFYIKLLPEFIPALEGLDGFGCVQVIWWFDGCDNERCRALLSLDKPYKKGPDKLGVFATRSPMRPNPIAVSSSGVTYIDKENGVIGLTWIDANDGTPVLDIKPYTPSVDRVENPAVPSWCAHWPKSTEESGEFDWDNEFNF